MGQRWPRGIDLVQSANWSVWSDFVGLDAANLWWHHGGAANSQRKRYSDFDDDSQKSNCRCRDWSCVGLDDYLTKPFEIEELFARIRVIERRLQREAQQQKNQQNQLVVGELMMDIAKHLVQVAGETIELTPKEFGILYELMKEPEVVKTRDELLNEIWGYEYDGQTNVVDVYIRTLRNKLDVCGKGKMIATVRGLGYVLRTAHEE